MFTRHTLQKIVRFIFDIVNNLRDDSDHDKYSSASKLFKKNKHQKTSNNVNQHVMFEISKTKYNDNVQ